MKKSEELITKIIRDKPKNEDGWIELEKEVKAFIKYDAVDEEKKELSKYTEMLMMVCNGIRNKRKK